VALSRSGNSRLEGIVAEQPFRPESQPVPRGDGPCENGLRHRTDSAYLGAAVMKQVAVEGLA
jgi:hypothetical protein